MSEPAESPPRPVLSIVVPFLNEEEVLEQTYAELKQLLPPAQVEYVEKQPTLEDIFLAIVSNDGTAGTAGADDTDN